MKVATTSVEILLIDDDADLCEMLGEYLAGEGFAVTACANGEAAADMAASGRYAAVLLDIMLPRVSGIDVLRQIRARCGVPVIMLTAKGSDIDRVIGLELGAETTCPNPAIRASSWPGCGRCCGARRAVPWRNAAMNSRRDPFRSCHPSEPRGSGRRPST
ncbi:response regulator [Cupriavidus plantarum]|uniref:response regulator n=1 Tax=Cupriavidus plantarum TaxID=942865 RepID=UPI001FC9A8AB|nr:response regulator [Cupriavidus plantarum]